MYKILSFAKKHLPDSSLLMSAMTHPRYPYSTDETLHIYEFDSLGKKGTVRKIVQFSEMSVEGYYNLGLGDYDQEKDDVDDLIVTNNGDNSKIIATVISMIYAFTGRHPEAKVFVTGTTEERTRLFRRGVSSHIEDLKKDFFIYGLLANDTFEEFALNKEYFGFLVARR